MGEWLTLWGAYASVAYFSWSSTFFHCFHVGNCLKIPVVKEHCGLEPLHHTFHIKSLLNGVTDWCKGCGDMRSPLLHTRLLDGGVVAKSSPCYGKMITLQNPYSHIIICGIHLWTLSSEKFKIPLKLCHVSDNLYVKSQSLSQWPTS